MPGKYQFITKVTHPINTWLVFRTKSDYSKWLHELQTNPRYEKFSKSYSDSSLKRFTLNRGNYCRVLGDGDTVYRIENVVLLNVSSEYGKLLNGLVWGFHLNNGCVENVGKCIRVKRPRFDDVKRISDNDFANSFKEKTKQVCQEIALHQQDIKYLSRELTQWELGAALCLRLETMQQEVEAIKAQLQQRPLVYCYRDKYGDYVRHLQSRKLILYIQPLNPLPEGYTQEIYTGEQI